MKILTAITFLLTTLSASAQTAYSPMSWGMNKGVTPYAFGANINGTWRDLGTVSAAGAWGLSNVTATPLNVLGTGTLQDIRSYGVGSNAFFVNPGSNLSFYGLPGTIIGDHHRASVDSIATSKFDVTKGEYHVNLDFSVATGKAVNWSASTQFTANQYIHGYGSGADYLYKMTGGTSPCTSSGSGSGPTSTTFGATSNDGTCVWTTDIVGGADQKVGFGNAVVTAEGAGHTWGSAVNLVNSAYIYNGTFVTAQETDLSIGQHQDCAIGFANCYTQFLSGGTNGMQTAEIAISHTPNDAQTWQQNTQYPPFYIVRTNVAGTDRVYTRTSGVSNCLSSTVPPSGTGTFVDGTCSWTYLANGTKAWATHFGILFGNLPNSIKDATIDDSSSATDGIIFYGAHAGANFNATNQTSAATPYFAKLASGQNICFNSASNCLSATGNALGLVVTQPSDNGGALTLFNSGGPANQRLFTFNAAGSLLYLQSYSDAVTFQSNFLSVDQSTGIIRDFGPLQVDGAATFNSGVISAGTKPTITGAGGTCAAGTVTGGALVGTVALTAACANTNTLTLTNMPTATTGYVCDAADRTSGVLNLVQTATTTTGATFTFNATTGATDVIQFKCLGY